MTNVNFDRELALVLFKGFSRRAVESKTQLGIILLLASCAFSYSTALSAKDMLHRG